MDIMKCPKCGKDIDLCAEEYCGMPEQRLTQNQFMYIQRIQDCCKPEKTRLPEEVFEELSKYLPDYEIIKEEKQVDLSNLNYIEFLGILSPETRKQYNIDECFYGLQDFIESRWSEQEVKEMYYQEISEQLPATEDIDTWIKNKDRLPQMEEEEYEGYEEIEENLEHYDAEFLDKKKLVGNRCS